MARITKPPLVTEVRIVAVWTDVQFVYPRKVSTSPPFDSSDQLA